MTELDVVCRPDAATDGWTCAVTTTGDRGATTRHEVRIAPADLERLDPGATEPHLLVDRSFRFLLAREPASSILRSFDLIEIGRYFPEYEATIARTVD